MNLFTVPLRGTTGPSIFAPSGSFSSKLPTVWAKMPERVRAYTLVRLREMGIDVRLGAKVRGVTPEAVILMGQEAIPTQTVVWTAAAYVGNR